MIALFTSRPAAAQDSPTVFVDVNVVPLDSDRVLVHQSVLIRDGKIAVVGPDNSVKAPQGARVIDGKGRYLMPGLVDMHVHFVRPPTPGKNEDTTFPQYDELNERFSLLFVANGITSVRVLWGHRGVDEIRDQILHHGVLGPTVYSTGPITDGDPPSHSGTRVVTTPEQARQAVRDDIANGYVATKVYDGLSLPVYQTIVEEARLHHFPVVGHVPYAVGVQQVIQSHQASIEHADSFLVDLQPDPSKAGEKQINDLYKDARIESLPRFAKEMKAADVWVCPTVVTSEMDRKTDVEEAKYLPPYLSAGFRKHYSDLQGVDGQAEMRYEMAATRGLHDAGVSLLAGSDTFKPNVIPGFSLLKELNYFVQAGLTPYEAIKAATSDPARFLHQEQEFGTVAVGRRADLLLLNANPLEDVHNATKRAGVMVRGEWFPEEQLQEKLKKLAHQAHASQETPPLTPRQQRVLGTVSPVFSRSANSTPPPAECLPPTYARASAGGRRRPHGVLNRPG